MVTSSIVGMPPPHREPRMTARTWLITGCSTGFGRALAGALLVQGERVAATARRPETLDALIAGYGEQALTCPLDVTDPEQVADAVAAVGRRFGTIDVLVNNAGCGQVGTVEDTAFEQARMVMETNFFGALAMIKAVLPAMIARRSGQIVNIGSVAGQIGFPALGYYSASKFALAGLTESLGAELGPLGIAVTLAELGPYATDFTRAMAIQPPSAHYDMAALAQIAGNADWGPGDPPADGVATLLHALAATHPPRRLILGQKGLDVVALHDGYRRSERARWTKGAARVTEPMVP
jgi:NAD(P)-dependent dehydrogenase (short-subunit alcohol dehydrogenase family)